MSNNDWPWRWAGLAALVLVAGWQVTVIQRQADEDRAAFSRMAMSRGPNLPVRPADDPVVLRDRVDPLIRAAGAGDVEATKRKLGEIPDPAARQEATYNAALVLGLAGKREDAAALAKTLTTPERQERALAAIARGDRPPVLVPPHLRRK